MCFTIFAKHTFCHDYESLVLGSSSNEVTNKYLTSLYLRTGKTSIKQESPPAWTQEAYRPQEGARCWPPPAGPDPLPSADWPDPPPPAGPHPPLLADWPDPPLLAGPDPHPPLADWPDHPPPRRLDLSPPPHWLTDLTPPRLDLTPPPVDKLTKWNYLPVVLRTRAVITSYLPEQPVGRLGFGMPRWKRHEQFDCYQFRHISPQYFQSARLLCPQT